MMILKQKKIYFFRFIALIFGSFLSFYVYSENQSYKNMLAPSSFSRSYFIFLDEEIVINYHPLKFFYKSFPFFSRRMIILSELGRVSTKIIDGYTEGFSRFNEFIKKKSLPGWDNSYTLKFKNALEDAIEFSLNDTIPNAIDAIFIAKDLGKINKDKELKIKVSVILNLSKLELEIRLSDEGIGINESTFNRWKHHFNGKPLAKKIRTDYKDMLWRNYLGGEGMGIVYHLLDLSEDDINLYMWGRMDKVIQPEFTFQSNNDGNSFEIHFPSFSRVNKNWESISVSKIKKDTPGTVFIAKYYLNDTFADYFRMDLNLLNQLSLISTSS